MEPSDRASLSAREGSDQKRGAHLLLGRLPGPARLLCITLPDAELRKPEYPATPRRTHHSDSPTLSVLP